MDLNPLLSHIELELQKQVSRLDQPRTKPFHEMLAYHMGWIGEGAGPEVTGKRIRPLRLHVERIGNPHYPLLRLLN